MVSEGVVVRKRGRPRKDLKAAATAAEGGSNKCKRLKELKETRCFICLEQRGPLVSCSKSNCPKVYHCQCVGRSNEYFVEDGGYRCRWVCGWHLCSNCQKTACYMCYTCTFSLCKGCKAKYKFVCNRENKGFCRTCKMTIKRIESKDFADDQKLGLDLDDKNRWDHLFNLYWLALKKQLALTGADIFGFGNHRKGSEEIDHKLRSGSRSTLLEVSSVLEIDDQVQDGLDHASEELLEKVLDSKFMQVNSVGCPGEPLNLDKKEHRGFESGKQQNSSHEEYAAIDVHNISMIYLRRSSFEKLVDDDKFTEKVVGSFVKRRILHPDHRQNMYRLVRVTGTCKANEQYTFGSKMCDVNLEVLNLGRKEVISISMVSNQEITEDECSRLRQSIRCGLIDHLKVGEVLQKARTLHSARIAGWFESEKIWFSRLRDCANEAGCNKEYVRLCDEELELLGMPELLECKLNELPEVHTDSCMDPSYESTDEEEPDLIKDVVHPGQEETYLVKGTNGSVKSCATLDNGNNVSISTQNLANGRNANVFQTKIIEDQAGENLRGPNAWPADDMLLNPSSKDAIPETRGSSPSSWRKTDSETEKLWLYADPTGKTQGPFMMSSLREWKKAGYFPEGLEIWRKTEKKEAAMLLTDALNGNFHKHSQAFPNSGSVDLNRQVSAPKDCYSGGSNFRSPDSYWTNTNRCSSNFVSVQHSSFDRNNGSFARSNFDRSNGSFVQHSSAWEMPDKNVVGPAMSKDKGWAAHVEEDKNIQEKRQDKYKYARTGWTRNSEPLSRASAAEKWDSWDKPSQSQLNNKGPDCWHKKPLERDHNAHTGWEMKPSEKRIPQSSAWEIPEKTVVRGQGCSRAKSSEISASERKTNVSKDDGWETHVEKTMNSSKTSAWDGKGRQDTEGRSLWDSAVKNSVSKETSSWEGSGWGTWEGNNTNWKSGDPQHGDRGRDWGDKGEQKGSSRKIYEKAWR